MFPKRFHRKLKSLPVFRRAGRGPIDDLFSIEAVEPRLLLAASSGFTAAYFNNADLTSPVTTETVSAVNFNWGTTTPAPGVDPNTFSIRFTGFIQPIYSQTYTFYTSADDGVRLYINGQKLIDRWTNQPSLPGDANNDGVVNFDDFQLLEVQYGTSNPQTDFDHNGTVDRADFKILYDHYGKTISTASTTDSASINLAAGQTYSLTMEYFQNANQANAKLEWQSASQSRALVTAAPAGSATGTGSGTGEGTGGGTIVLGDGNGLFATYYNNTDFTGSAITRIDPQVSFLWSGVRPQPRIDSTTFSVRWEGQVLAPASGDYTFYANSDDGTRLWVDNQLQIDVWGDKTASEYPSDPIHLIAGQKYNIRLEYYQDQGDAMAELKWGGPVAYGVIPTSQLFPTITPPSSAPPEVQATASLRVSNDGRYIVRGDGSDFFWLADTAWSLFNNTTLADVDTYLQDRAGKNFTVTQAVLYNPDAYTTNLSHQPVFLNNNPATPNPAYFAQVDYTVQKALSLGMFVQILPTWGDAVAATDSRRVFNTDNAYAYGLWLGQHYASQPNIIWSLGGDWPADTADVQAVWRAMAQGLQAGDGGAHVITFHPTGGQSSTQYFSASDSWLTFNEVQSGHTRDSANYDLVSSAYNASFKPVVDAEPNYEGIPNGLNPANQPLDDYDVRKKTYWSLFAGAFGAAYGDYEVYQFYSGSDPNLLQWQDALSAPGSSEMQYARQLMQSRPYTGRVPDQSLIAGSTLTGTNHIQATRGGDGSFAFIYSASGQNFTVDMTKLSGQTINAIWFNPRDGSSTYAGQYSNTGTQTFEPPSSGYGNDWVLSLDDASRGYTEPVPIPTPVPVIQPGDSITGSVSDSSATIPYRLYEPAGVAPGQKVPLILYLHGMGERGTDNITQTTWMGGLIKNASSGQYASYILAPQIDTSMWFQSYNSSPTEAMKLTIKALQQVIATENIDTSRIYVTGVSMGGMGVWDILRWLPDTFAAAVPMSAAADPATAPAIKDVPVWAFQGSNDTLVPASATRAMIQALRNAGGTPKYTEITGGGHVIWDPIYYDSSNTLYPWLFAQQKGSAAGAVEAGAPGTPVASAAPPRPVSKPVAVTKPTAVFSIVPVVLKKPATVVDVKPVAVLSDAPAVSKPAAARGLQRKNDRSKRGCVRSDASFALNSIYKWAIQGSNL